MFACVRCKKPMGQPYVVTNRGPLGPKCAAALGLQRPSIKKDGTPRVRPMRLFSVPRSTKTDPNQLTFFAELEAAAA